MKINYDNICQGFVAGALTGTVIGLVGLAIVVGHLRARVNEMEKQAIADRLMLSKVIVDSQERCDGKDGSQ